MKFGVRAVVGVLMLTMASACGQNDAPAPTVAPAPETTSQAAGAAAFSDDVNAPPTVNGMYVVKNACPGEGCYYGRMQASKTLDLYDAPSPSARVVGQVAAGEWMDTVLVEDRFAPLKGVVRTGGESFKTGDVVYRLSYEGEGCFGVWDRGQLKSWCDLGEQIPGDASDHIDWEAAAATDGSEGLWVQVKRDNGIGGWLRDPKDLRCIGLQDRDADCPALPN